MAATSVGQIGLDLVVNKNGFEKQMSGITGLAKKAGAALAAAFAVKKLVDFGKSCIDLGSDLAEVQNVVDVTFPAMTAQVDAFAKSAISSFGLSETMAKQFSGTFGAMAKAFGFSESAAYDMSTALTGLAGDVASFYNIDQKEAYTKLKSVFTGETESLKDLGVVMTQTALDAYALANGYGKTVAKMSEAEKVALRYKFVQQQLTAASGDFLRTSDGWANQVRVLKLQFDSLKATIGQGLINVLTPVIKVINTLVGKLMTLANAFKAFTEMFSGGKKNGTAADMKETADAAGKAADATGAIGTAAAKSAKAIKGAVSGFDELNVLQKRDTSGSGAGETFDFGNIDTSGIDSAEEKCQSLNNSVKELIQSFSQGFREGIGDISVFDNIKTSMQGIKGSLHDIFTDSGVQEAATEFASKLAKSLGQQAGSFVSMGASVADNLTGGLSDYLSNNKGRIQDYLVSMFGIGGRAAEISGNLSVAMATVFESLRSDGAKRITESIIGMIADAFMGATELLGSIGVDLYDVVTAPFIENSDGIKKSLEETFGAIAPIFEDTKDLVDEVFSNLQATYDEKVSPVLMNMKEGISDTFGKALEAYDTYIVPALNGLSEKFGAFKDQHLSPLIEKFNEFAGKVAEAVGTIWDNYLKPFADWFIQYMYPKIAQAIGFISDVFFGLLGGISDALGGLFDILSGLIDFITGVFSGDWELAWTGIKEIFGGIWDVIYGILSGILEAIWSLIENVLSTIASFFGNVWNGIKSTISQTVNGIYGTIRSALGSIKSVWESIWTALKTSVSSIFDGIWSKIKSVINSILGGIDGMVNGVINGVNAMIRALNGLSFDIPDWVPVIGGGTFGLSIPELKNISIPKLAQGGYVKPNTPQLAMIGDNRHQGEVVAPEDKLQEMANKAAMAALGNSSGLPEKQLEKIITLLELLIDLIASGHTIEVGGERFGRILRKLNNESLATRGKPILDI